MKNLRICCAPLLLRIVEALCGGKIDRKSSRNLLYPLSKPSDCESVTRECVDILKKHNVIVTECHRGTVFFMFPQDISILGADYIYVKNVFIELGNVK